MIRVLHGMLSGKRKLMSLSQRYKRTAYLREQKEKKGKRVLGVFPALYPRELLWSMDILPVEIWDPPLEISYADAHLQTHICSVVRLGLELILQGKCNDIDGFLFPHTCDSIQNLSSIVHDFLGTNKPCYFLYYPRSGFQEPSKLYYSEQLKELASQLEKQFGTLDHENLRHSVEKGREVNSLLNRIYDLRATGKSKASNEEFYRVIRQGEFLHPDDFIPLLKDFLDGSEGDPGKGLAVILSGILPNPPEILSFLDRLGVRVADDDLLSCGRRFSAASGRFDDPFESMTEDFFNLSCATRNASYDKRIDSLVQKIDRCHANGVIFNIVKFCEPEFFELPLLLEAIKKRGIKTLVIESEPNQQFDGQLATRVEAFIEMIKA
jgi:benzoyl-CoA reductase/2-hydroxyglutaryl-CoA dehydratase subunit BcrC/BadD/HgdB